jgi:anti-sigma-K factor RskA
MTPDPRRARLEELLATEATQGLSRAETDELDALLAEFPDEDPDGFELAAAALHLALGPPSEPLPAHMAEKLHLTATVFTPASAPSARKPARPDRSAWLTWAGWAVAATLAGVLLYTNWPKPQTREPDVAELRDQLKAEPTAKTFADAKPDMSATVIWSDAKKEGYLEVRGLKPNDPSKEQYQLWIVDAGRTDKEHAQPVSGGVFDVKPDGTALVRVDPAIKVSSAAAFAITKEPAGGVTVSKGPMLLVMNPG